MLHLLSVVQLIWSTALQLLGSQQHSSNTKKDKDRLEAAVTGKPKAGKACMFASASTVSLPNHLNYGHLRHRMQTTLTELQ